MSRKEVIRMTAELPKGKEKDTMAATPSRETNLATRVPAVDIFESGDEIVLRAEMPGVDDRSLTVTAEDGVLTVEGRAAIEQPAGHEPVTREYAPGVFRRSFELSDRIDAGAIRAKLKNGLLTLLIPRRQELRMRRIAIETES